MQFSPRHDLVSCEHSKGCRLACTIYTKQAKALLSHIWLVIGYCPPCLHQAGQSIHKPQMVDYHPKIRNSYLTLSLTPKVRPRTASNLPNFLERLHTVIAFGVCNIIVANVGKQILLFILFLVPGTLCPFLA